jgi:hypothetical protein
VPAAQNVYTSVQLGYLCESTTRSRVTWFEYSIVATDKARYCCRAGSM